MMMKKPENWQAWVWHGGDSILDLRKETIAMPLLSPGQVLVRNAAIGLNPVDWKVLSTQQGKTPGVDGAGVVVAIADDVDSSWLGKHVAYHQSLKDAGSFAEYTPIMAHVLLQLPVDMSFNHAAAFPCPGLTAWQAIEKIPPRENAELLIAGAGGAVGLYLTQLAVERGFAVTALCHPRHWEKMKACGVAHCLPSLADALSSNTQRYYAVIDCVNEDNAKQLSVMLRANGHIVCIQGRIEHWPDSPFSRAISLHEVALGPLHQYGDLADWRTLISAGETMLERIQAGTLQPENLITSLFDELPQQLNALKFRNFSGKQVIEFPEVQRLV